MGTLLGSTLTIHAETNISGYDEIKRC